jgi:hypothetical protein
MILIRIASWRPFLLAAGVLMIAGSATHPRDPSMQQMLMNPIWVPSHALMLAGYVSLLASLVLLTRPLSPVYRSPWPRQTQVVA